MALTPQAAMAQLTNHPRTFLKANLVKINQFPGASRTIIGCKFQSSGMLAGHRYGTVLGSHNLKDVQDFTFAAVANVGMAGLMAFPNMDVDVQFVQMFAYAGLGAIPWHVLTLAGPDIMITTKLTGCSFLVRDTGGGLIECAHIQPNGAAVPPQTGQALRQTLSTAHAGGYDLLFGRGRSGLKGYEATESASVIGIRRNGAWNIYAQRQVGGQDTFKDVERIFPR